MAEVYIVNLDDDWQQELVYCKDCVNRNTEECPIKDGKNHDTFYCASGEKE